ncbi:putative sulfoacetate--CoA ligase [bacterium YEK0313]|nr:putative sulfoacetate--CoA ligase [bacterium YEK0313]
MVAAVQDVAPVPDTLAAWLDRHAAMHADAPALAGPDGTFSYGALRAAAMSLAAGLAAHGIGRGDVVAVQLPNGAAFVTTYLACGYLGAVLQTVHMPYRAGEIEPLVAHSRARAMICLGAGKDGSPARLVLSLQPRLPHLRLVAAVGAGTPEAIAFEALRAAPTALPDARPGPDDRFVLLYTSGTTAAPKGVPVPARRFLANARLSAAELGIDARAVLLSAAPFSHLYGLFSVNLALAAGAATAILPAYTPAGLAEALTCHRPSGLFVAPAHLAAGLAQGLIDRDRLASLRFVLISGSLCPPDLARALQDLMPDGKVCQLWGMSELQAGSFTRPGDAEAARLGTVGRASPGTELRIAGEAGPAAADEEGELQVRGASVFAGYLDNAEASAAAFTADGWFRTGDLGRLDAGGNLTLTGRLKEVINRGGVKFNPADVEATIARHPAVEICAIVPMPDPVLGERACCFAVAREGTQLDLAGLRAFLEAEGVARLRWPERLELIDDMPMTPTRKIRKAELVTRAAALG